MEQKKIAVDLIVVANSQHIKIFSHKEGQNLELLKEQSMDLHHHSDRHASSHRSKGTRSHSFDTHTPAKDIDNDEAAKFIVKYLHSLTASPQEDHPDQHYRGITITAEPKLLGNIRHHLDTDKIVRSLVIKEVAKDFINEDIKHLQEILNNIT